jgi:hypothetical protein
VRPSPKADRPTCAKAIASWTAPWCSELKAASPDRQLAQIRPRISYGTRCQSLRHIKREGSIGSSQPMTGQRFGPDHKGNRAPPGPLPGPDGKARWAGRSTTRSVIQTILTLVAERNLTRGCRHSRLSGVMPGRRFAVAEVSDKDGSIRENQRRRQFSGWLITPERRVRTTSEAWQTVVRGHTA